MRWFHFYSDISFYTYQIYIFDIFYDMSIYIYEFYIFDKFFKYINNLYVLSLEEFKLITNYKYTKFTSI